MVYVVRSVLLGIKIAHAPVMVHGLLKGELFRTMYMLHGHAGVLLPSTLRLWSR